MFILFASLALESLSLSCFLYSIPFLHFFSPASLSLETSGRLMELGHKDGRLRVHYSDRLVTLLREVRQLSALGFPVPSKIQHTSSIAEKFYRHAVVLKQVCACINLLGPHLPLHVHCAQH